MPTPTSQLPSASASECLLRPEHRGILSTGVNDLSLMQDTTSLGRVGAAIESGGTNVPVPSLIGLLTHQLVLLHDPVVLGRLNIAWLVAEAYAMANLVRHVLPVHAAGTPARRNIDPAEIGLIPRQPCTGDSTRVWIKRRVGQLDRRDGVRLSSISDVHGVPLEYVVIPICHAVHVVVRAVDVDDRSMTRTWVRARTCVADNGPEVHTSITRRGLTRVARIRDGIMRFVQGYARRGKPAPEYEPRSCGSLATSRSLFNGTPSRRSPCWRRTRYPRSLHTLRVMEGPPNPQRDRMSTGRWDARCSRRRLVAIETSNSHSVGSAIQSLPMCGTRNRRNAKQLRADSACP